MISPALRQRLQTAEAELERLTSAPKPASIESLLPRLPELIRAHVRNLASLAVHEPCVPAPLSSGHLRRTP